MRDIFSFFEKPHNPLKHRRASLALLSCLSLSACAGTSELRPRAAFDMHCPEGSLQLHELDTGNMYGQGKVIGVEGCSKTATYIDHNGTWVMNSDATPTAQTGSAPASK